MHYEAITRKQRYCRNAQWTGFKKASECNALHFCMHWITSQLYSTVAATWFGEVFLLLWQIKKYYLHAALLGFSVCHLQTASDIIVFNAAGMFSTVDDSLKIRSFKKSLCGFYLFYPHVLIIWNTWRWLKHYTEGQQTQNTLLFEVVEVMQLVMAEVIGSFLVHGFERLGLSRSQVFWEWAMHVPPPPSSPSASLHIKYT